MDGGHAVKIALIGAGSTYTPELVSGLHRLREQLPVRTLVLHDPDLDRLAVVAGLVRRMLAHQQFDLEIVETADVRAAVEGASAVLIQLRVGGQRARLLDETLPLPCGCIGQETTGAGGAAKALRTVPVVLRTAELVRELALPDAWIVDFTNPVGIVTRALLDAGHRAVGLCNFAIGMQRWAAGVLDADPSRVQVDPVGLNHFSWIRRILLDGSDVLPDLLDRRMPEVTAHVPFPAELMRELGAIPSYYLHYYYDHDQVLAEQRANRPRAEVVMDVERVLLEKYADPATVEPPPELGQRGGSHYSDAAVDLLASLLGSDSAVHVVNVRNGTTLPTLAPDDVIEVPCRVDRTGAVPLPQPPTPPDMTGRIAAATGYERLIAEAAVRGEPSLVRRALLAHPLIGQWAVADDLTRRILEQNAQHLPQFTR